MVYRYYIKRGSKRFGPYYYRSYRENGKFKKEYLGTSLPKGYKKTNKLLLILIFGLIGLAILGFLLRPVLTGFVVEEAEYEESLTQEQAEINKPVKWQRTITITAKAIEKEEIGVKILKQAYNIKVNGISDIETIEENWFITFLKKAATLTGFAVQEEQQNLIINITELNVTAIGVNVTNITEEITANITENITETNVSDINITNITEEIAEANVTEEAVNITDVTETNITEEAINETINITEIIEENITEEEPIEEPEENITEFLEEPEEIEEEEIPEINITNITEEIKEEPEEEEEIELPEKNITEIQIEYETPGPKIREEEAKLYKKAYKKRVIVYSDIHYENVTAYTGIPELTDKESAIKLYHIVDGSRELVEDVEYFDENNNGLIDKLQWIVPSLSEQEYEVVIEISEAQHLDENKQFISDIYDRVYQLDNVWSEPIYHNEYVRVTFEQELDSSRDITLYARNIQGLDTIIEVYYFDSTERITEFPIITEEKYYKVYLTGMQGSHDAFDLKIKNLDNDENAYLVFDYIVDPTTDALGGYGTFNTTTEFGGWNVIGDSANGTYSRDTVIFIEGGGSLLGRTVNGNGIAWSGESMNRSTISITSGSTVWLNLSFRKASAVRTPAYHNMTVSLVKPGGSAVVVWEDAGLTEDVWTNASTDISTDIDETGNYQVRLGCDMTNGAHQNAYTQCWFDEVFIWVITVAGDTAAPTWSGNKTNASDATKTQQSVYFNVTWTDANSANYTFAINHTGTWVNYTGTYTSDVPIQNISTITATRGQFVSWYFWANDTGSYSNQTDMWNFTVANTAPTFNESLTNQEVTTPNSLNYDVNCSDADYDNITYYVNDTIVDINSSTGLINDTTTAESEIGSYSLNVSCGDGYDNNSQSFNYTIKDGNAPTTILVVPADNYWNDSAASVDVNFTCNATDGYNLKNISLYITDSSNASFSLNSSRDIIGTANWSNWTLSLVVGNYTWNCLTYDEYNNTDWADDNRTLKINYTAPAAVLYWDTATECNINDTRSYNDQTIIATCDVVVNGTTGGVLNLQNVTFYMNETADYDYDFTVEPGATLNTNDSTQFLDYNGSAGAPGGGYNYYMYFKGNSSLNDTNFCDDARPYFRNSSVNDLINVTLDSIYVYFEESSTNTITNSTFSYSAGEIYFDDTSQNTITNSTFSIMYKYFQGSSINTITNSTFDYFTYFKETSSTAFKDSYMLRLILWSQTGNNLTIEDLAPSDSVTNYMNSTTNAFEINLTNVDIDYTHLGMEGNSTNRVVNSTFNQQMKIGGTSQNTIINSTFTWWVWIYGASNNTITNTNFTGSYIRFYGTANTTFDRPYSSITNIEISDTAGDKPEIHGYLNLTSLVSWENGTYCNRYFPIYVYEEGTSNPVDNANVTAKLNGTTYTTSGLTNSSGYVELNITFDDETGWNLYNFTLFVNDVDKGNITFLNDTSPDGIILYKDVVSPTWSNNQTNASDSTTTGESVYFNVTFNDSNPDTYIFAINQTGQWVNYSGSYSSGVPIENISIITASEGTFISWYFWANDTAGNTNQTYMWNFTVASAAEDNPPSVTLNAPANYANLPNATVTFNCSISDDNGVVNVSLYGNWTDSWTVNETNSSGTNNADYIFTKTIAEGTHLWNCEACDDASPSQCNFSSANRTFTVDTTPPTINITSPQNITYTTASIDLNWTYNETLDWCAYSLNGASNDTSICPTQWWSNSDIISGLTDIGYYSAPEVFEKNGTWYLISGENAGTFYGFNWTDSTWQSDSNIVSGLGDVGLYSAPTVFNKGGTWYMISGNNTPGEWYGFNWTGSTWQNDSNIVSGLGDIGDIGSHSTPEVFEKDGTWYLITGKGLGSFRGFNWTDSAWQTDNNIISGLGGVGSYSAPTVFNMTGTWYLITGEGVGTFEGRNWTGSEWQSDSNIVSGLGDIGIYSIPTVFNMSGTFYLIAGEEGGQFYGYKWGLEGVNTTITAQEGGNSVTVWANDTAGNMGSDTVYFTVDLKPTSTLISPANASWSNGSATFTCNGSDGTGLSGITLYIWNSTGTYSTNATSASGISNQTSWNYTLSEDNYTWNCLVNDTENNEDWDINRTLYVDTTYPTISVTFPQNNSNLSLTWINITGTASDTNNDTVYINDTRFGSNQGTYQNWNFTNASITDGTYSVLITANDSANNTNSTNIIFTIDRTAPTWSSNLTNASNSTTTNESVYFNITFTEGNPDTYIFAINQTGQWVNYSGSYSSGVSIQNISTITAAAGTFVSWYFWANDTLGNSNQTDMWNFTVAGAAPDNPPSVTLSSPANDSTDSDGNITFECNVTDDSGIINISLYTNTTGTWHRNHTITNLSSDLEIQLSRGEDDVEEAADTTLTTTDVDLDFGKSGGDSRDIGIRFLDVKVPKGATITNAFISGRAVGADSALVNTTIKGVNESNSAVWTSGNRPSQRNKTAATVDWDFVDAWTDNAWYNSSDISSIIQEIIDLADWQSGNNLSIVVEDRDTAGAEDRRDFDAYENAASNAMKLYISYSLESYTYLGYNLNKSYNASFNVTDLSDGSYIWNCLAYDNASTPQSNWSDVNWTVKVITAADTDYPAIDLQAPANDSEWTANNSVNFVYNVTDVTSGIMNCSLYINDSLNTTDTSVTELINQSFDNIGMSNGYYNWSVECFDDSSNYNKNTSVTWYVLVNYIAPQNITINITSPQNITYTPTSIDLNWTYNETLDWCAYSLNGAANDTSICPTQWWSNSSIVSGLVDVGYHSSPTVFNMGGTWYLIAGESTAGEWNGYNWTGSTWQSDSNIVSGLLDVGSYSTLEVFYMNGTWYLISGENAGTFYGFNWTGSAWQSDSNINSSLGDVGLYSAPTVFNKGGTWYLIAGASDGKFNGYNWTGSAWQNDSHINSSLPYIGSYSTPTVFNMSGTWYLIAGEYGGQFYGFNWTGSAWQSDGHINASLSDIGSYSAPTVFNMGGTWYLIAGEYDGVFNGYDWGLKGANTTITAQEGGNSITIWANNTAGNMGSDTVYFSVDLNPKSTLISPPNATYSYGTTTFTCNGSDATALSGITLYIWNSTGTYSINATNASGTSAQVSWDYTLSEDNYIWNCLVNDTANREDWDINRTLYVDTTFPQINFTSPTEASGSTINKNYTYVNVSVSDANNVSSFINWNNSLVGYWSFENVVGGVVYDNSTYGNNGTMSGFASNTTTSGKFGSALQFDGSDDDVDIPSSTSLDINNNEVTLEVWVKLDKLPNEISNYMGIYDSATDCYIIYEDYFNDLLRCKITDADGSMGYAGISYTLLTINTWYHVACVYDGNTHVRIYLNGVQKDEDTNAGLTGNVKTGQQASIGSQGTTYYFEGTIDEVRVWNRALSVEEINASYNTGTYRLYHNFTSLADSNYSYYAQTIDLAGNVNQTETRTLSIDTTAPTWSNNLTNASDSTKTGQSVYFNVTFTDTNPDTYIFAINQTGQWVNYSGSYSSGVPIQNISTITASEGTFISWYFWANDTLGNSNQTDVWNFTITNAAPTTPTNITCAGGSCNISVDASVVLNASGSTDAESDAITYIIEASLVNATTIQNTTDVNMAGEAGVGEDLAYYDDFESDFGHWATHEGINCPDADAWGDRGTTTPSGSTGPQSGGVGGVGTYFIFVETSSGNCYDSGDIALVYFNTTIDYDSNSNEKVEFYFDAYGSNIDSLYLEENSTGSWIKLWEMHDINVDVWNFTSVDLSGLNGTGSLRFNYTRTSSGYYSDIALDRINVTTSGLEDDIDANTTATTYNDVNSDFKLINNITVKVEVDSYNPEASVQQSTNDPDLYLEIYNGSDWIGIGEFDLNETYTGDSLNTTNANFSKTTTDSTILAAWQTSTNQDLRIKGIYIDYYNSSVIDEINYTNVWVTINGNRWKEIGNHTETTNLTWDTTNIDEQTCIDLRSKAIDLSGSNTYSSYYTKGCCLNISHVVDAYPTWSNNLTNASDATKTGQSVYFNVTLDDDSAGSYQIFAFYNGTDWVNDSAETWSDGDELEEIRTITATRGMVVKWYWWFNDSADQANWTDTWNFTVANTAPTQVTLVSPADDNTTTNRTPTFSWNSVTDADGDSINYTILLNCSDNGGQCTLDDREPNVTGISNTSYTPDSNLKLFGDDSYYYNWSVAAYDGYDYGAWSSERKITINSLVSLTLTTGNINFGELQLDQKANTTDPSYGPFVIRNDGNCYDDLNISSNNYLWTSQSSPSQYFRYKVDNVTGEEGAFNSSGSQIDWSDVPVTNTTFVDLFNYADATDSAEIDILVQVPMSEPPGNRSSILTFTGWYVKFFE